MRSRRPHHDHQEAVSRRLALLSQELAGVRPPGAPPDAAAPDRPPDPPPPGAAPAAASDDTHHTRVRAAPAPPPEEHEGPPPVPVPGRHAARRPRPPLLPPTVRGRVGIGPAHLAVVAVAVALGLGVTAWWVVRGEPRTVAAPVVGGPSVQPAGGVPVAATTTATAAATPAAAAGEVTVDVAGRVRRPGIVVLDTGARVVDAIEAAGGARPGVDLQSLNLARVLVDGEQVLVGVAVPAGVVGSLGSTPGPTPGTLVNLNTATQPELESLPEVGPVTAQAILAWRSDHGGFSSVEELLEVDGIGEATLATVAPLVTV